MHSPFTPFTRRISVAAMALLLGFLSPCDGMAAVALRQALPALRASTPEVRRIFVEVAVAVLADRFLVAARNSRDDNQWARHTRNFVGELWRSVDLVRGGANVALIEDPDRSLRIVISGRGTYQFTLTPPRLSERDEVEAEVMTNLCRSVDCSYIERELLARADQPSTRVSESARPTRAVATPVALGDGRDGLGCSAESKRHPRLIAVACKELLREVRALAEVVRQSVASGVALEWGVLNDPLWRQRGRELMVGTDGTTVSVNAPLLGRYPAVLRQAMPWLKAWLGGHAARVQLSVPERLVYAATRSQSSE